jgi:hypothetical protein
MALTDNIKKLIESGIEAITLSKGTASSNLSTSDVLKNQLYENADKIQSLINSVLEKGGVITAEEVSALDEQIRISKLKVLEAESKVSGKRYATYVVIGLVVIGAIWYFTYKKK